MQSEKFIRNNTALITLIAASLVVLISLGVRQTFGMFFMDFRDDLGISLIKEIPRSSLKSIKNIPKVCLTPNEIRTTKLAAIKVINAVLFLINFSDCIEIYFKCLRACFKSAIRSLGSSRPI